MDDFFPVGSRGYVVMFLLLLAARGMDFLSTWIATPNMVLEGNPLAKKLGWRWGIPINLALCLLFAFWPFPAVVISTTSILVAARNFQGAWLMRTMGEQRYREWHMHRVEETSVPLYLFCLFSQTALTAGLGVSIIYFSDWREEQVLLGIGLGVIAFAAAILFYSLLGFTRLRRHWVTHAHHRRAHLGKQALGSRDPKLTSFAPQEDISASGS